MMGKQQKDFGLGQVWSACVRHRGLALGVPAVVLASTVLFLWWTPPIYEGVTTLRIDQERSGIAVLEALRTLSSGSKITTEIEELRSRTLAETVVDSLGLPLSLDRPRKLPRSRVLEHVHVARTAPAAQYVLEQTGDRAFRLTGGGRAPVQVGIGEPVRLNGVVLVLGPGAAAHDRLILSVTPFPETVRQFQTALSVVRPNREADLIRVSYRDTDAALARAVPDLIAGAFIARRNAVRTREARSTGDFLADQIATLHAQLTITEDELRSFQERSGALGIEAQSEAAVRRLAEMQADRERLDVERQALARVMAGLGRGGDDPLEPSPARALLGVPSLLRNPAAAELLNALNQAEAHRAALLERRTLEDSEVQVATRQIQQIDRQLGSIAGSYLAGLTAQVNGLDRTLMRFSQQLNRIPEQELQLARLRRQAGVTEELYTALQLRLKEAEIMAAVDDPSVRVIDPATDPNRPVKPSIPLSLALAMMAGMVLGVGSAVAREQLDDTVHSRDELQAVAKVPVLGAIPRLARAPVGGGLLPFVLRRERVAPGHDAVQLVDMLQLPGVAEAYRSLRTNITFARLDSSPRTLVVTSPAPGDGKSTTAANLAVTMAQQGHRVLLIDADMRRGRLFERFGVAREPGLSNVLRGQTALDAAVHAAPHGGDRPSLLPTGTIPPNPAELLGSERMGELLAMALHQYDVIVLDAPPLNMVTDAAVLGRHADGVLVVARAGVTKQAALAYTFEQLAAVNAPVLGSILNDADPQRERHYGSYMDGYYESHA
jgi:tyrosine-protein kinase Etk/Wzc